MKRSLLEEAIEQLPERYRYVLVCRYGLDDRGSSTLAMLGNELKISGEWVKQLQRGAEHMLKRHVLKTGGAGGDQRRKWESDRGILHSPTRRCID